MDERSILLNGPIDGAMVSAVWQARYNLEKNAEGPVTIWLTTGGGNTADALAVYDLIRSFRDHVTIIGTGAIYSSGMLVFQAGDERVLTPNAVLMNHDGIFNSEGISFADLAVESQECKRLNDKFGRLIAKRCGLSYPAYLDVLPHTRKTYINAQEAVRIGLADRIVQ